MGADEACMRDVVCGASWPGLEECITDIHKKNFEDRQTMRSQGRCLRKARLQRLSNVCEGSYFM